MSLLSTTMALSHTDIVDYTNNVDLRDNVIIMDIDNILAGWPMYKVKFTPQQLGHVVSKLISTYVHTNNCTIEGHQSS